MTELTPDASAAPGVLLSGAAPPVQPLLPGTPPLAILVDYDGTIALTDVSDTVMAEFVSHADWERIVAIYDAGRMGSRRLMEWEVTLIRATEAELLATAAVQPHDPGFAPFARRAVAAGIPVEVVSDGFGFFIGPALARLGLAELPIVTARTTFGPGGTRISWPNGHPDCQVCGTCKRQRVLAQQAAGRTVVFIGDGESDRYAAGYADLIFAKRSLVPICLDNGWAFERWTEFAEIHAWLNERLDAWRIDPVGAFPPPTGQPLFCGPEVWGPGVQDPPGAELPPDSGVAS
jgi:2-hydroxy-3-keto-5-methylthiopentenyl-1-phosphate phosphatase